MKRPPRWARTLVLVGVAGLLPLAPAHAGQAATKQADRAQRDTPPTDRVERDAAPAGYTHAVERLRAAVERGDMTPEQARRTLAQLRNDAPQTDRAPDADPLVGQLRSVGVDGPTRERVVAYFAEHGVGRIQMEATLRAMVRLTHAVREQGDDFTPNADMARHLQREIGLDAAQARAVLLVARKLATDLNEQAAHAGDDAAHGEVDIRGYFLRLGLDEAGLDHIIGTLREHGVGQVQIDPTLGGLFHTVLSIKEHGLEATVGDEHFRQYFTQQVGLDEEQIELVTRVAQRIARATRQGERETDRRERDTAPDRRERDRAERDTDRRERDVAPGRRERERADRVEADLAERAERERAQAMAEAVRVAQRSREELERVTRERIERVERETQRQMEEAERVARARAAQAERERAALVRELEARAQRIAELEQRLTAAEAERERRARQERERAERDQPAEDKPDFAAQAERLRAAFTAGELSRADARRQLNQVREQMVHEVELALEAEQITRDEAREKVAAIREMTRLPEREGDSR